MAIATATAVDEIKAALDEKRNGVKLIGSLQSSMLTYFVSVLKVSSIDELDLEEPAEVEAAAKEAWKESEGDELPDLHARRARKWAGEVVVRATKDTPIAPTSGLGEVVLTDRLSAARKEVAGMGLSPMDEDKLIKDMAAQGISGDRIKMLSLGLVLGKVVKLSEVENLKYGMDPMLSDSAKVARKAGTKMLSTILSEKNIMEATAFFSGLMQRYASDAMVEESAIIANWWAESMACFGQDKDLLFDYLKSYFDKYMGRGLPCTIDVVLVTRLRNTSSTSGMTKEEGKAMKNRCADLETAIAKLKSQVTELTKKVDSAKSRPTAEEQAERRKNVVCHICQEKGHYASECPKKKKEDD